MITNDDEEAAAVDEYHDTLAYLRGITESHEAYTRTVETLVEELEDKIVKMQSRIAGYRVQKGMTFDQAIDIYRR